MKYCLRPHRWTRYLPILTAILLALSHQNLMAQGTEPTDGIYLPFVSAEGVTGTGTLTLGDPGPQSTAMGSAVYLAMEVANPSQETLIFSAVGLPDGLTLDPNTGVIAGMVAKPGSYSAVVTARSASGGVATATFQWTVDAVGNQPPLLQRPDAQLSLVNSPVTLNIVAQDPEDDALTFTAAGLPVGLTMDAATGQISGVPLGVGTSTVTVNVSDGKGGSDSTAFEWSVTTPENNPPVITPPGDQSNMVGDTVNLTITAIDADADAVTFAAANLPPGLGIEGATGQISGTVSTAGSYVIYIIADDGQGGTDTVTVLWQVSQLNNNPPTITSPGDQVTAKGAAVSLAIVASDPDGDALSYTADGLPNGLAIDPTSGQITGIAEADGTYSVTISVDDGSEGADAVTLNWRVTEAGGNQPPALLDPGLQQDQVDEPLTLAINATDPDGDALSYVADGLPTGLTIEPTTGLITGTPTTTGTFTPTVTVDDNTSGSDAVTFTWRILPPGNSAPTVENPGDQSTRVGQVATLPLSATDPDGDAIQLSVANLPPGLKFDDSTQTITGTTTATGSYDVKVVAEDGNGGSDSATFTWTITPIPTTTVGVTRVSNNGSAFESTGRRVMLRVERSEAAESITVNLGIEPNDNSATASVSLEDFVLRDADENVVVDTLTFAPTQTAISLTIEPIQDDVAEVPEVAYLAVNEGAAYVVDEEKRRDRFVIRDDFRNITEQSRLFVAQFGPENGAATTASGIATVRLANDNSYGNLSLFFTGLTSEETASHIHIDNNGSAGPIAFSIPLGQVVDERWQMAAAHHLLTNQAMLDQLMAGELYVNVHSSNYPSGEIRGNLLPAEGTIEMQPPPAPDPIEALAGFDLDRDIARFLTQATFGPTPGTVADMRARVAAKGGDRIAAYSEWIDEQLAIDSPSLREFHHAANALYREGQTEEISGHRTYGVTEGWFTASAYSQAELRERIGFALSEIFVISIQDNQVRSIPQGTANYYDMLRERAFGSYENLLRDVSLHPIMGTYLSHLRNQAERRNSDGEVIISPDENYAREIMQLFSIGLLHIHPDGTLKLSQSLEAQRTYDQNDITELARVFTGWGLGVRNPDDGETNTVEENLAFFFGGHNRNTSEYQPGFTNPMKMFEDNGRPPDAGNYARYHDNGAKRVLGVDIPAGLTGEADFEAALAILVDHPNTAPFIAKRLIQRLVLSNPSRGYIYRVATVFEETDGNLGEVVRAILLDSEARNLAYQSRVGHGKKKEPLVHLVAMLRLIQASSEQAPAYPLSSLTTYGLPNTELGKYDGNANILVIDWGRLGNPASSIAFHQAPLHAPTVFNWFSPSFAPPGAVSGAGLVAPELQLITENQVIRYYNFFYRLLVPQNLELGRIRRNDSYVKTVYDSPSFMQAAYMAIMDSNSDGALTPADAAFADETAVAQASIALVNELDLYLCSGRLQNQVFRFNAVDPRFIIADSVFDGLHYLDGSTTENAEMARDERIKEALFLVSTAPECLTER